MNEQTINNNLIGVAGVHFVVSELSLRGFVALPTIRNTAGMDIVVATVDGSKHANLQVKSSLKKVTYWPVGKNYDKIKGKNNFYVFVRYILKDKRFEIFLENADIVFELVKRNMDEYKKEGKKEFPYWELPKNEENLDKVRQKWLNFNPSNLQ